MQKCIHIKSSKFPILPGEKEELVNDGMYGKALAQYLQAKLGELGYEAPFVCCEDWGWWVELKDAPFAFGVCIYAGPTDCSSVDAVASETGPNEFVCTDGAVGPRIWSWRKLRFIDTTQWSEKLHSDLMSIFQTDEDVEVVGVSEEFPW